MYWYRRELGVCYRITCQWCKCTDIVENLVFAIESPANDAHTVAFLRVLESIRVHGGHDVDGGRLQKVCDRLVDVVAVDKELHKV